jgi:hypothetical protein
MKQQMQQKRHCDEFAAAEYLDVSVSTMRDWRIRKRGPVYAKFGKAVRYPVTELEKFAEAARVRMAA